MVPVNSLAPTSKDSSLVRRPRDEGIIPLSLLPSRETDVNDGSNPMLEEIVPTIDLLPRPISVTADEVHVTPVHGPGDEHTGTSGVEPVQVHPVVREVPLSLKPAARSHIASS